MELRKARREDLEALLALEGRAFRPEGDYLVSRRAFEYHLKKETPILLIPGEDRVVGYVMLFVQPNTRVARIYSIAIDPCCQGKGLGRKLLEASLAWAKTHGKDRLSLEVRSCNEAAVKLYTRFGFKREKVLPSYYPGGQEGWRMKMTI